MEEGNKYLRGEVVRELLISFIKGERQDQGISIDELAGMVHVKPGTIRKIEALKFKPPVDLLFEIMAILGCRILVESKGEIELIDDNRYQLSVTEQRGVWHCLDKQTKLTCRFTEGNFDGSQYFALPDEVKNEVLGDGRELAGFLSINVQKMTEWLLKYHINILQ